MHPVRKWEGGMGEGSYEKMSERDVGRNGFNGYGKGCGVEREKNGEDKRWVNERSVQGNRYRE